MNEQRVIRVGTSILRPCKILMELWSEIDDGTFTIHIVPFDDTQSGMEAMLSSLGEKMTVLQVRATRLHGKKITTYCR